MVRRTVSCREALSMKGSPFDLRLSAESDRAQVFTRPLGDGERLVERRRVHVLLDNGPAVVADVPKCLSECGEVDGSNRGLAEHVIRHGDGERNVFLLDPLLLLPIDALEMQVRNARVMAPEEGHGVAAAI